MVEAGFAAAHNVTVASLPEIGPAIALLFAARSGPRSNSGASPAGSCAQ